MDLFSMFAVNGVFVLAPLLCYFIYQVNVINLSIKKRNLLLDFALVTSSYLVLKYGFSYSLYGPKIMFGVPLLLAFLFNRKFSIIILSIIGTIYYHSFGIDYVIIEYIMFLIITIFIKKYKEFKHLGLKLLIFINSLFSFLVVLKTVNYKVLFAQFLLTFLVYYFVVNLIIYISQKFDQIVNMNKSIRDLQNLKEVRESIFKITHEIKNPIAVCKGYLDMLDYNKKSNVKKYIPIVKEEINRTLLLLQDFLCLNGVTIQKEELDINYLLEETIENFKPLLNEKRINIQLKLIDDEIYIQGDYNRLVQVFINIIKNSIESINTLGNIVLEEEIQNNFVVLKITDSGEGISKEDLEKIMTPFFTTKKNGTGLGVTLSKEIIELHGGIIKYESVLGEGTTVIIKLKTQ